LGFLAYAAIPVNYQTQIFSCVLANRVACVQIDLPMVRKPPAPDTTEWATRVIPVLAGTGGLVIYLLTLNCWVSLLSLGTVGRVAGWFWQFPLDRPLSFLVSYPFHLLPEALIPLAMNSFTAVCAALVLALLARSVALLPHDRTWEQRVREYSEFACLSIPTAWVPPVLAVIACGLQLTFWEHATSATGEMIRLLVFAYIIRALLEFRIDQDQKWLSRSALLYGAAMADHWLMIGYFPLYLGAIVRLKRWRVLDARFLRRMSLLGLAGLTLYLALPLLASLRSAITAGFVAGLKTHIKSQRDALLYFPKEAFLGMALISVLPLVAISIRWRSQRAYPWDDSLVGAFITKGMFRLAHALLLAAMLWLALDPRYSPRNLGLGVPFLTQHYISALIIGYCAGYFLLIGTIRTRRALAWVTLSTFGVLVAAFAGAMIWRNLDQVRLTNGPAIREFARQCYNALPPGRSVVLCDNSTQLFLLQAEVDARHGENSPLLLHAPSLPWVQYHWFLAHRFPSHWPVPPPTNRIEQIDPTIVRDLLTRLANRDPLLYLNRGFSVCLEWFTARPAGLFYRLAVRTGKEPVIEEQTLATNELFWQNCWTNWLQSLAQEMARQSHRTRLGDKLLQGLSLTEEPNPTLTLLGALQAKSLDDWGVQLKKRGREPEAAAWFQRAVELNPENLSAHINLECQRRRRQGLPVRLDPDTVKKQFPALFEKYRDWDQAINECGPVDEPSFLWETARGLSAAGHGHQAIDELERCIQLAPDWLEPKLALAQTCVSIRDFARVLQVTDGLETIQPPWHATGLSQLLYFRATALFGLGRTNEATTLLERFIHDHADSPKVLSTAAHLLLRSQRYALALGVLDRLLKNDPANTELLSNKAIAEMQLQQFDAAITNLTAALALDPSNQVVRLNRAIVSLRAGQTAAARADYLELLSGAPHSWKVLYGLAETAWREQDTNNAIRYYQECLLYIPAELTESQIAAQRLRALKGN
jgi:tetratricopeptide (TPR) repeat protein